MAETTVSSPAPRRPRRWLRIVVGILGLFIVLLVALYFVGTSSAFFKGVILRPLQPDGYYRRQDPRG